MALSAKRSKILGMNDIKFRVVPMPEWGVDVLCKGMSVKQRAAIIDAQTSGGKNSSTKMYGVVITNCFDPDTDEPYFEAADMDSLLDKSSASMDRLVLAISELSGIGAESDSAAEKN